MLVDLSKFSNSWYSPGRNSIVRMAWHIVSSLLFQSSLIHNSSLKALVLRFFGSKIGEGVVFKPSIIIKYPWNFEIGNHSWVGEGVWLDTLAPIKIGSNCCISQGTYLCTGNHDWSDPAFGLFVKPIIIEDGAWIGAKAIILPGVTLATHSVVAAGAVISKNTLPYTIYAGNPAVPVKSRVVAEQGKRLK